MGLVVLILILLFWCYDVAGALLDCLVVVLLVWFVWVACSAALLLCGVCYLDCCLYC